MGYLYGDATESSLDSNYLELLKAAVDLCVGVLESTDQIKVLQNEARYRKRAAAAEREQLQSVAGQLEDTLKLCLSRADAPFTNQCVHQVRTLTRGEIERSKGTIESDLESELARIDKEIRRQRESNHSRLETLLLEHDLPHSRQWIDYRVAPNGAAAALLVGTATSQLTWNIELDIPAEHALHEALRVDRLFPQLTIEIPEMAGWIRKRIKLKTYKLTKDYIVGLQHRDGRAMLQLRTNVAERDSGFDITYQAGVPKQIVRLHKGNASEPCEPEPADVNKLQQLLRTVSKSLSELRPNRRALKSARLDDKPLDRHKDPGVLVERLVGQMAPVVAEISAHSLSPTELVLKRVLADDQRVEIFASKADLNAKIETLAPESRRVFAPLQLDQPNPVPGSIIPPAVRSAPAMPAAPKTPSTAAPKSAPPPKAEPKAEPKADVPKGAETKTAETKAAETNAATTTTEPTADAPAGSAPNTATPNRTRELPGLFDDSTEDAPSAKPPLPGPAGTLNLAQIPARPPVPDAGAKPANQRKIADEGTVVMPVPNSHAPPPPPSRGSAPKGAPPLPSPPPPRRRTPPPPPQRPPAESATSVEIDLEELSE